MSVSPKWLGGYRGHRGHRGQKGDGLRGGRRDILADIISALNSHLKKYKKYFFTPRIGLWTTNCGSDQGFLNAKWVFFMSSFCDNYFRKGNFTVRLTVRVDPPPPPPHPYSQSVVIFSE